MNEPQHEPKGDKAIIEQEQRSRDEYNAPGWHRGPAKGGPNHWYDGDTLLIAVETSKGFDFALVGISADEESASLEDEYGESFTDWSFDQIDYWIHKRDIAAFITPASTPADAPTDAPGEAGEIAKVDAVAFLPLSATQGRKHTGACAVVDAEFAREQARTIATLRAECAGLREERDEAAVVMADLDGLFAKVLSKASGANLQDRGHVCESRKAVEAIEMMLHAQITATRKRIEKLRAASRATEGK